MSNTFISVQPRPMTAAGTLDSRGKRPGNCLRASRDSIGTSPSMLSVAQWIEHRIQNPAVAGSNPA